MLDRGAAVAETRSPPPCGEGSGVEVHKQGLGVIPTPRFVSSLRR
jgi:hypothetical protein